MKRLLGKFLFGGSTLFFIHDIYCRDECLRKWCLVCIIRMKVCGMGTHMIGRYQDGHRFLFLKLEDCQGYQSEGEVLCRGKVQADNRPRQLRRSILSRSTSRQSLILKVCSHLFRGKVEVVVSKLFNLQRDVIDDGLLCS